MQRRSSSSVRVFYPEFSQQELIEKLRERIPTLAKKLPLKRVVLFGSWAKGNFTTASDIDLLIIYSGRERKDAFALAKTLLRLPGLEPHIYSESSSRKMKSTLQKMLKNGIILLEKNTR